MTDARRAMLTQRERDIVSGEADVSDSYRYQTISRVRRRFEQLASDLEAMDQHGTLGDQFREAVGVATPDEPDLDAALEQLIEQGRAARLCPDCHQRLPADPDEAEDHDCSAA
ncbi:MAG: hypothetical protein U5J98_07025 [Halobacteriales archaeon]|nr:hypothetical protein [Halobacteriales archaeon]